MRNNTNKVMLPIWIALGFLIFTELFFFMGPIAYHSEDPYILVLFLAIVNICLYTGYKKEAKIYRPTLSSMPMDSPKVLRLTKFLIVFAVILKPISMYVGWQLPSFTITAFVVKFFLGLYNPQIVYADFNTLEGGSILSLLLVLLSPISYMAMPIGVYHYKKLNITYKILVIVLVLLGIIYCLGLGNRKIMLDEILIVSFSYFSSLGLTRLKISNHWKMSFLILAGVAGIIFYFTYSSLARNNTEDLTDMYQYQYVTIHTWYKDNTSPDFYFFLANIQMYLCHAYKNLSVALHDFITCGFDWVFSFGLGNNSFTLLMFNRYLGINLNPYTYQYLLNTKYGLDIGQQWMTIYPWLANDVTFLGVPFVIHYIGRLLARFWKDCLYRTNVYAIPLLSILAITVFYSFANNQGLSYSFLPAVFAAILYMNANSKIYNWDH